MAGAEYRRLPYTAIEPDVLRAMAESFTVDEETAPSPLLPPRRPRALGGVQEEPL